MAWFTVQYRDKDGAKAEAEYEAADRSALFKMLSGRNITPVRVVDGRLAKKKGAKSGGAVRGIIAGLIVVVGALAAFYFLVPSNSGEEPKQNVKKQERKTNSRVTSKPAKDSGAAVKKGKIDAARQGADVAHAPVMAVDEVDESAATNIVSSSKEDRRLFKNPMDQLLSMVLPKKPGATIPPLPNIDSITFTPEEEDQLLERLAASDDDSDEKLERKEFVQALRDEYHELKKSHGWRFVDYVKALEAKVNLDAEVLSESIKINETVFNDASISDEEYSKTLEKINAILAARGIEPIGNPGEEPSDESDEQQKEN